MNEVLRAIKERRTTRKFKSEQIKEEELQAIIEAGLCAPSSINQQGRNFTVIQNKELLSELSAEIKKALVHSSNQKLASMGQNEKYDPTYGVPTIILVSKEDDKILSETDCSASIQNMLLAAHSLGVASCWNGLVSFAFAGAKANELKSKFNIPDGYSPYYGVLLGYSDSTPSKAPARKENVVQYVR